MTKMFAVTAFDKPNSLEKRLEVRPTHLKYWDDNADAMVLAGPFLGEDGNAVGSMMVVTASGQAAAEALVGNDPYAVEGVFESVTVRPWNWVIKRPETL